MSNARTQLARSASVTSIILPAIAASAVVILGYSIATALVWAMVIYAVSFYYNLEPVFYDYKKQLACGILMRIACTAIASYFGITGMLVLLVFEVIQFIYNWFIGFAGLSEQTV